MAIYPMAVSAYKKQANPIMMKFLNLFFIRKPLYGLLLMAGLLFLAISLSPAEKTLGSHIRLVYLHGVWVWTSLAAYLLAGIIGMLSLILKNQTLDRWSLALGRTGLLLWLTYLPISMLAMQTNWNGLFFAEPRWRVAFVFAIGGLGIQTGLALIHKPYYASAVNILFGSALFLSLGMTPNIMHPGSPIYGGKSLQIQIYFTTILMFALAIGWLITRFWYNFDKKGIA